ncbi:unnamed protein product [Rhizoctonia solani]|uniref:Uncharacterized protein n=1 Tax=Rhizoctonia solani TaxID=456999 RepID=A0A8H3HJ76_9AGAM|nr:unnamed protein product [Rhizoctonia solani]
MSERFNKSDWMTRLPQLLVFTNLTHFSFKSESLPRGCDDEHLGALTSLLQSSPQLESIILSIEDLGQTFETYSPTLILEPLGDQFVFPHLHTFHMLGDADPDWFGFVSIPSHPLRAFLARHTSIRDLAIGFPLEDVSGREMDPNDLSQILPSVKHLAFPSFLLKAVVTSKLASQLESLAISDPSLYDDDPLGPAAEAMGENTLPNLRKLAIWADMGEFELGAEALVLFFSAAKGLEELEFRTEVQDYGEFLSALCEAENLRQIKLDEHRICRVAGWEFTMIELGNVCPRLEVIASTHGKGAWKIVRGEDRDEPSIIKVDPYSL